MPLSCGGNANAIRGKGGRRMEKKTLPIAEVENLASASECTGLTPAAVQSPEEGENYAQLYAIHEQKPAWENEELAASRKKNKQH